MSQLSVIIPIYNAEKYLHECIDSVVNQTQKDIKIILVDDGSIDNSPAICDAYVQSDNRISVIHKKNGGVCDARNVGINAVETEFFTFMESDDWFPLDACEKMMDKQKKYNADFVLSGYYKVSSAGTIVKHPLPEEELYFDKNDIKNKLLEYVMGLTGSRLKAPGNIDSLLTDTAKIYRTEIVKKHEIYWVDRKKIYSDCLDYILRYANCCSNAIFFDEPVYYYRRTNVDSQTAGYRRGTLDLWLVQFDTMRNFIEKNGLENLWPAFYSRICFSIIPIGGNAYRTGNRLDGLKEVHEALDQPIYKEAFNNFRIGDLPIHFRPLFFFAKHKMYRCFYDMTVIMRKIMNKQRGM